MRSGMLQLGLASVSVMPLPRVAAVALHLHLRLQPHLRQRLRRMMGYGAGSRNRGTMSYVSFFGEATLSCVRVGQGLPFLDTVQLASRERISRPPRLGMRL